jgi:hypothetical protein
MKTRTSFLTIIGTSFFMTRTRFEASASLQGQQPSYESRKTRTSRENTRTSFFENHTIRVLMQASGCRDSVKNSYEFRSTRTNRPSCRDSLIKKILDSMHGRYLLDSTSILCMYDCGAVQRVLTVLRLLHRRFALAAKKEGIQKNSIVPGVYVWSMHRARDIPAQF